VVIRGGNVTAAEKIELAAVRNAGSDWRRASSTATATSASPGAKELINRGGGRSTAWSTRSYCGVTSRRQSPSRCLIPPRGGRAAVVLSDGASVGERELRTHAAGHLATEVPGAS
jgi:hypothetical protein